MSYKSVMVCDRCGKEIAINGSNYDRALNDVMRDFGWGWSENKNGDGYQDFCGDCVKELMQKGELNG